MTNRIPFNVIKKKAAKLLSNCDIDLTSVDVTNPAEIAIDLEKIAAFHNIRIEYHDFSDNISGVFFKKNNKLFLGVNSYHSENRQRFTIAHEIGHYILHTDDILHHDDEKMHFRADKIQSSEETEANFFAAEILMPALLIEKCVENDIDYVDELAKCFNVSQDAMRYRLTNLGYL